MTSLLSVISRQFLFFVLSFQLVSLSRPSRNLRINLGGQLGQKHSLLMQGGALEILSNHGLWFCLCLVQSYVFPFFPSAAGICLLCNLEQDIANPQDSDFCRIVSYDLASTVLRYQWGVYVWSGVLRNHGQSLLMVDVTLRTSPLYLVFNNACNCRRQSRGWFQRVLVHGHCPLKHVPRFR